MTPAARMGRPPALDQDRIAEAVLDVGFDELTFAAVRDRLGVGQTTLYRHAANRNELVRIGLDHALTHADWPDRDGPWRKVLEEHAVALWRLWAQHPGMATEAARGIVPPTMLRMTDELCAVLLRQGFTPERAVLACDIVFDMVTDNRRGIEHVNATALTDADRHANEGWRSFPLRGRVTTRAPAPNVRPSMPPSSPPSPRTRSAGSRRNSKWSSPASNMHLSVANRSTAAPADYHAAELACCLSIPPLERGAEIVARISMQERLTTPPPSAIRPDCVEESKVRGPAEVRDKRRSGWCEESAR